MIGFPVQFYASYVALLILMLITWNSYFLHWFFSFIG